MSKYAPLKRFLLSQPGPELSMTFSQVENLIGASLPPSARRHPAWWANHATSHVNAQAWLEAGWKTSGVNLSTERVVFVRRRPLRGFAEAEAPAFDADAVIVIPRALLTDAATRILSGAKGATPGEQAASVLNEAALGHRRALIDKFSRASPQLSGDSAAMIREDRDAR